MPMKEPKSGREFHRRTAAQCFNKAWDYLELKRRTPEADREMLHLAHASRYHWGVVGGPKNLAVGDWQLSRAYAELEQPQLALQFAKSSLEVCEKNGLSDIVHTANEAMARAYAVSGELSLARKHLARARRQLDLLKLEKEDRTIFTDQIEQTARMIGEH